MHAQACAQVSTQMMGTFNQVQKGQHIQKHVHK